MSAAQNPSLIQEYSSAFTSLQAGKKQLIQWGAEPIAMNRYIVDAAGSTSATDPQSVLQAIDINKVSEGETEQERSEHCAGLLKELIALQEEVVVLQKAARESGISAGLLTIVGQAATQSPSDNGASVLRQLGELVGEENNESANAESSTVEFLQTGNDRNQTSGQTSDQPSSNMQLIDPDSLDSVTATTGSTAHDSNSDVANDAECLETEKQTKLQQLGVTLREHWGSLLMDASVCVVATGIAISLVN